MKLLRVAICMIISGYSIVTAAEKPENAADSPYSSNISTIDVTNKFAKPIEHLLTGTSVALFMEKDTSIEPGETKTFHVRYTRSWKADGKINHLKARFKDQQEAVLFECKTLDVATLMKNGTGRGLQLCTDGNNPHVFTMVKELPFSPSELIFAPYTCVFVSFEHKIHENGVYELTRKLGIPEFEENVA